ncbi:hypothetical protein BVC80_1835g193 [Macleaya cordata]|uniref:Uncharacterized protein n=1 Tax=Macleaya cordata TaxID=56857 RepID=A0A200R518_MACCD|nr:hypothetical protein BVC80_1835g192 [Macleaya cordata]OVA17806.1 hypothetical protein BVC80_1835g193 [Macleaya cordata]
MAENNNNIFRKDIIRGRGDNKPPSRLQKQSPATLQLDPTSSFVVSSGANNNHLFSSCSSPGNDTPYSNCPIPLLSPLVLTPPPLPLPNDDPQVVVVVVEEGSHHDEPRKGSNDQTGSESINAPSPSSNAGWEHPAAPASAFIEPSSLISFLQSQCVLVHHIQ